MKLMTIYEQQNRPLNNNMRIFSSSMSKIILHQSNQIRFSHRGHHLVHQSDTDHLEMTWGKKKQLLMWSDVPDVCMYAFLLFLRTTAFS